MRKLAAITGAFLFLSLAGPVLAAEGSGTGAVSLGAKLGTLGTGLAGEYRLNESFSLGLGAFYFKYDFDFTADDIDYDAELTLASATVLAHYYPGKGRFRLTGGLAFNGNEIHVLSRPEVAVEIGDTTYPGVRVGTINGNVDFRTVAPYLGLGWGPSAEKHWGFTFDIGVLFQGAPKVDLTASGPISLLPGFQEDLAQEEQKVQDELEDFQYYPIAGLGVYYRF